MKKLFFLLLLFTSITAMAQRPASLPYRQTNQVYQGDTTKSILTDTTMLYWTTEPFFDFNKPIRINGKTVPGTDTANYTTNGLMSAYDYRKLQLQTGTVLSNRGYYDASVDSKEYVYRIMYKASAGATPTEIWNEVYSGTGKKNVRIISLENIGMAAGGRIWTEFTSTSATPGNVTVYGLQINVTTHHLEP